LQKAKYLIKLALQQQSTYMKNYFPTHMARMLFGLIMLVFGLFHFLMGDKMAGMVPAFLPGGVVWVYITGLGLAAAGLSFILEKMMKLAGYLLAVMLLLFVVLIHAQNIGTDNSAIASILKDLGLAMGSILIANASEDE
jgi:uncharacterized membrane protein